MCLLSELEGLSGLEEGAGWEGAHQCFRFGGSSDHQSEIDLVHDDIGSLCVFFFFSATNPNDSNSTFFESFSGQIGSAQLLSSGFVQDRQS